MSSRPHSQKPGEARRPGKRNDNKIERKHGVTFDEVEEACLNAAAHDRRRTRAGLTLLYSRTGGGRYLQVVLAPRGGDVWSVVTARDMNGAERRLYREQKGLA